MAVKPKRRFLGLTPCPPMSDPRMLDPVIALNTEITSGTTQGVAAIATAGNAQTYNCSTNNSLTVYISKDAGSTYFRCGPVTISGATPAATTAAEAAALLNANAMFSKYAVADVNTNALRITTRDLGLNAAFYVGGSANTPLGFTQVSHATKAVGTGTVATVPVIITDTVGNPLAFAPVTLTLYAAADGDTKDATAKVNRLTQGTVVSGLNSNTVSMVADASGRITVEIADSASGSANTYLEWTVSGSTKICSGLPNRTEVGTVSGQ